MTAADSATIAGQSRLRKHVAPTNQNHVLDPEAEAGLSQLWRYRLLDSNEEVLRRLAAREAADENLKRKISMVEEQVASFNSKQAKYEEERNVDKRMDRELRNTLEACINSTKDLREGFSKRMAGMEDKLDELGGSGQADVNQASREGASMQETTQLPQKATAEHPRRPQARFVPEADTTKTPGHVTTHLPQANAGIQLEPINGPPGSMNPTSKVTKAVQAQVDNESTRMNASRPVESSPSQPSTDRLPKIRAQGTTSLPKYIARAAAMAKTVSEEEESYLISSFIKGIHSKEVCDKLLNQLHRRHSLKRHPDGRVEVLRCKWPAVENALRQSGLI